MPRIKTWNNVEIKYLQQTCRRKRTCHTCNTSIPKGERHLALHAPTAMGFWKTRQNVCFVCLEHLNRDIKKSIPKIKERRTNREKELFLINLEKHCETTHRRQ